MGRTDIMSLWWNALRRTQPRLCRIPAKNVSPESSNLERIRQIQIEAYEYSARHLVWNLQKYQRLERRRLRNDSRLKEIKDINN